tara:strand:- start:256 stop:627 length:372 start_codon:yes stop_codon:yes gene_type:complete
MDEHVLNKIYWYGWKNLVKEVNNQYHNNFSYKNYLVYHYEINIADLDDEHVCTAKTDGSSSKDGSTFNISHKAANWRFGWGDNYKLYGSYIHKIYQKKENSDCCRVELPKNYRTNVPLTLTWD